MTRRVALVAFVLSKRQLARIKKVPDVDAIYNPLVLSTARVLTGVVIYVGARLDRGAIVFAQVTTSVLTTPERALSTVPRLRTGINTDNGNSDGYSFRSGVGFSVLLLVIIVAIALLVTL
jgi:hypothetical protein